MGIKAINKAATKTFLKLVEGLKTPGTSKKVGKEGDPFMAVCVEFLDTSANTKIYSIAHYYEAGGDLCAEPEILFAVWGDDMIMPTTYQHADTFKRCCAINGDGSIKLLLPRAQKEVAAFCNLWMKNIKAQQNI